MKTACPKHARLKNSRGFTFIEVLVAVVILSIGLIGLAGLQTLSMSANNSGLIRSQAVLGAEDILDRMRANRAAALATDYNIALTVAPAGPTYTGMVLTDLSEWKTSLAAWLAGGDGSVTVNGNIVTIVVQWTESLGTDTITVVTRL